MFNSLDDKDVLVFDIREDSLDFKLAKDFKLYEFKSSDGYPIVIVHRLLPNLAQAVRDFLGHGYSPNSAYRSPVHNFNIGGSPKSMHVRGMAIDVPIESREEKQKLIAWARENKVGGIGVYDTFVHLDLGPQREWDG